MIVLLAFALLAGAGTALSPCVLPVLPALLSAGGAGGRRRPLGVVIGLSVTFTVTIIGVACGRTVAVAVAYAAGSALVLLALTLGGRRIFDRLRRAGAGAAVQRGLGVVMVLTAVSIAAGLDVEFDQFVAQHIPNVNLTASLECTSAVTNRLHEISGHRPRFAPANGSTACEGGTGAVTASAGAGPAALAAAAHDLPDLGTAPEFTDTQR